MNKKIAIVGLLGALGACNSGGSGTATGGKGGSVVGAGGAGAMAVGGRIGGAGGATVAGGHGGGAGGASACGPLTVLSTLTSSGTMSWKDNGTLVCPSIVLTERTTSGLVDSIEIDASAGNYALDIALASYDGLLNGAYTCQAGNGTTMPYVSVLASGPAGEGGTATTGGCIVNIAFTTDAAGVVHAQGTVTGMIAGTAGTSGSDTITEGMFDVSVPQMGGGGAGGTAAGGSGGPSEGSLGGAGGAA